MGVSIENLKDVKKVIADVLFLPSPISEYMRYIEHMQLSNEAHRVEKCSVCEVRYSIKQWGDRCPGGGKEHRFEEAYRSQFNIAASHRAQHPHIMEDQLAQLRAQSSDKSQQLFGPQVVLSQDEQFRALTLPRLNSLFALRLIF